ncbi:MAG: 50S ribosomal protein L30 [Magnetococcus sp. DMHC-6]
MAKTIKVQLYKSPIGQVARHRLVIQGMGLTKMNQIRELPDNVCVRGMVAKVHHLVRLVG